MSDIQPLNAEQIAALTPAPVATTPPEPEKASFLATARKALVAGGAAAAVAAGGAVSTILADGVIEQGECWVGAGLVAGAFFAAASLVYSTTNAADKTA